MAYDPKVKEMVNKLYKMYASCIVCGKGLKYPFKKDVEGNMILRCKEHQKSYEKIWFKTYSEYLKIFRGQT